MPTVRADANTVLSTRAPIPRKDEREIHHIQSRHRKLHTTCSILPSLFGLSLLLLTLRPYYRTTRNCHCLTIADPEPSRPYYRTIRNCHSFTIARPGTVITLLSNDTELSWPYYPTTTIKVSPSQDPVLYDKHKRQNVSTTTLLPQQFYHIRHNVSTMTLLQQRFYHNNSTAKGTTLLPKRLYQNASTCMRTTCVKCCQIFTLSSSVGLVKDPSTLSPSSTTSSPTSNSPLSVGLASKATNMPLPSYVTDTKS